ncbi:hypothetical protein [uncultured Helicobacter sp.]|uniref:hypothetical protein n=1 Tax=uncultured Helicobacter sp. TaxID=175537 RepID=UPI002604946C|nr:hypothetical protein [uncultured Helicobacter sp.]
MNAKIKEFIKNNHLLSLSVLEENSLAFEVYSASCYYAFDEVNFNLLFKSAQDSKHIKLCALNPRVGVIIAKDSKNLAHIQGLQIKAFFKPVTKEQRSIYYALYPFAKLGSGEIYALEILWAKYTDNRLLLKEKLTYIKE